MDEKKDLDFLGSGLGDGLGPSADDLLKQIQRSILDKVYRSRHSEARELRKYHRHYSPKARARKKVYRKTVAASRRGNR